MKRIGFFLLAFSAHAGSLGESACLLPGEGALRSLASVVAVADGIWEEQYKKELGADFETLAASARKQAEFNSSFLGKKHPAVALSDAERVAIAQYTVGTCQERHKCKGPLYSALNQAIRDLAREPGNARFREAYAPLEAFDRVLRSALSKLPPFEGKVTRKTTFPPAVLEQHKKGAVVTYDAYTSTSGPSADVDFPGDHRFEIQSRSCRSIAVFAQYGQEDEVLCAPGTRFEVLERSDGAPPAVNFVMREVVE